MVMLARNIAPIRQQIMRCRNLTRQHFIDERLITKTSSMVAGFQTFDRVRISAFADNSAPNLIRGVRLYSGFGIGVARGFQPREATRPCPPSPRPWRVRRSFSGTRLTIAD